MDQIQKSLCDMKNQKPACLKDRSILRSALADYLPNNKLKQNLILNAFDNDIVQALNRGSDVTLAALNFISQLENDYGITKQSAIWAVETWCYLLDLQEIGAALASVNSTGQSSSPNMRYVVLTPEIPWQSAVLTHLHAAWNTMEQEQEDYKNLVRYHLSAALHLLVKNSPVVKKSLSQQEQVDAARVRGMLEYIHGNFTYDLTMKEISRSISSSNSVCLRCFHQLLGTTPIQYLKNYRLEKAAQLLKTTAKTAKEIALECGFNDISYFTKSFRKKMGCTPKEYQKQ